MVTDILITILVALTLIYMVFEPLELEYFF